MITPRKVSLARVREEIQGEGLTSPRLVLKNERGQETALMPIDEGMLNAKLPPGYRLDIEGDFDGQTEVLTVRDPNGVIPRFADWPDCYLHVRESRSGEEWIQEISGRQRLSLRLRLKDWVRQEFGGELRLAGEIMPRLEGDYYAQILTDGRDPYGNVCWCGGGFYLEAAQ